MSDGDPDPAGSGADELVGRLQELVARLQEEQRESVPRDEPYLASRWALKGGIKRGVFRMTRPATRRYDRLATELATVAVELAERLHAQHADIETIHGDLDRLDHAVQALRTAAVEAPEPGGSEPAVGVPDDYYWAFEQRMRGSSSSVVERLRQYERFAIPLHAELSDAAPADEPPLWLDLGCGLGELCVLAREWGWRVHGVDSSPEAVDASRAKDIDATLADAGEFLQNRRGEPPGAISAIQLIEHLPRGGWIRLFEQAHGALAPGGGLLVETINGLNPEALAAYFVADVTHSWPGHPETLSLMAEHAGFERTEVMFLNPDHRGNAQDFAIWARKSPRDRRGRGIAPNRHRRVLASTAMASETPAMPSESDAQADLLREMYWARDSAARGRMDTPEVRDRLHDLAAQLRTDETMVIPMGEGNLASPNRWRRQVKYRLWRVMRPATWRYDRLIADHAELTTSLAEKVLVLEAEVDRLKSQLEEERSGRAEERPS